MSASIINKIGGGGDSSDVIIQTINSDGTSELEIKKDSVTLLESKTVDIESLPATIEAGSDYDGLKKVNLNKPSELVADNIKSGIELMGVTGTYDPTPTTETKIITPSASTQIITPTSGSYISQVTVNGDADLTADNIKSGTDIFGVTGTYEGNTNYKSATATAAQILSGYIGVDSSGDLITGTMEKGSKITYGSATMPSLASSDTISHGIGSKPDFVIVYDSSGFAAEIGSSDFAGYSDGSGHSTCMNYVTADTTSFTYRISGVMTYMSKGTMYWIAGKY